MSETLRYNVQWMVVATRACFICDHRDDQKCMRVKQPIDKAREPHGACGTEAKFLSFPGLDHDDHR